MDNASYNAAIDDIVKMLEGTEHCIERLRIAKMAKQTLRPVEDDRMVEQLRTIVTTKVRIDNMRKGPNLGYLLSPEQHSEDIEYDE